MLSYELVASSPTHLSPSHSEALRRAGPLTGGEPPALSVKTYRMSLHKEGRKYRQRVDGRHELQGFSNEQKSPHPEMGRGLEVELRLRQRIYLVSLSMPPEKMTLSKLRFSWLLPKFLTTLPGRNLTCCPCSTLSLAGTATQTSVSPWSTLA